MEYRYLKVKDDGKSFEIVPDRFPNPDWAFKSMDGAIYPCSIYDAVALSDEIVSIGGRNHYISTLKAVKMDEVVSLQGEESDDKTLILKNITHKLPDPFIDKLPPFTSAIVIACLRKEKNIALTKEEHQNKLTIIRSIRGLVGTDVEMTIKKAEELLSYYGLDIRDILKDEFIVNKG